MVVVCLHCSWVVVDGPDSIDMQAICDMWSSNLGSLRCAVRRYSYHTYGKDGGAMALDAQHIRSEIIADAGIDLPVAVSE